MQPVQAAASWPPFLCQACALASSSVQEGVPALSGYADPNGTTLSVRVPLWTMKSPATHQSCSSLGDSWPRTHDLLPSSLQSSKVLAKRELLCVPLIGWTWYFLEIVFCKRKWEEDRDTVIEGLRRLADYPEHMWVSPCTWEPWHGRPHWLTSTHTYERDLSHEWEGQASRRLWAPN